MLNDNKFYGCYMIIVRISTPYASLFSQNFMAQPILSRHLFSHSFNSFARPAEPLIIFRRNFVNYTPFASYSPLADLCSTLMRHQQLHFFPSFHDHFSSYSRSPVQSSEAQLRRAYGISENEDLYSGVVQRDNDHRHEQAIQKNTDGASYLKSVIGDHLQTLSQNQKDDFKKKVEESDPELFIEIPRLAVKKAISSATALTKNNTPCFMHAHLDQLEQLRQKQKQLTSNQLWKDCCNIATSLARETDCIASMQKALENI